MEEKEETERQKEGSGADVVQAAVRGGSLLMLLAFMQRFSTFFLNVMLQRSILSEEAQGGGGRGTDKAAATTFESYGAASITLELLLSTTLFLSREPFRLALSRSPVLGGPGTDTTATRHTNTTSGMGGEEKGGTDPSSSSSSSSSSIHNHRRRQEVELVNMAWVVAPVGVAAAAVMYWAYPLLLGSSSSSSRSGGGGGSNGSKSDSSFDFAVDAECRAAASLTLAAAALELMVEPISLIFQQRMMLDVRVTVEVFAVLVLNVSKFVLIVLVGAGLRGFGYAQVLHSLALAGGYSVAVGVELLRGRRTKMKTTTTSSLACSSSKNLSPSASFGADASEPGGGGGGGGGGGKRGGEGGGVKAFTSIIHWLPSRVDHPSASSTKHYKLTAVLAGQTLFKHLLTEGDKLVLARVGGGGGSGSGHSLYDQGVYAVAHNYGSLVVRLILQPIEESSRLLFSKLGAAQEGQHKQHKQQKEQGQQLVIQQQREKAFAGDDGDTDGSNAPPPPVLALMADLFCTLLKLALLVGALFVCFGANYTDVLLRVLLKKSSKSSSVTDGRTSDVDTVQHVSVVLSTYCCYVLLLAANGMCEALVYAVAGKAQVLSLSVGLLGSFAAFWASIRPLMRSFGTSGLVLANCVGMSIRIVISCLFIRVYFSRVTGSSEGSSSSSSSPLRCLRKARPHPVLVLALLGSFLVTKWSEGVYLGRQWSAYLPSRLSRVLIALLRPLPLSLGVDGVVHITVGLVCLGVVLGIGWRFEKAFQQEVRLLFRPPPRTGAGAGAGAKPKTD